MKRLKQFILKWLGITKQYNLLYQNLIDLEKKVNLIFDNTQIGVDHHVKSDSWAVVCVSGKSDYVKFLNLGKRDAQQLKQIIQDFGKSCVDTIPCFVPYFKNSFRR